MRMAVACEKYCFFSQAMAVVSRVGIYIRPLWSDNRVSTAVELKLQLGGREGGAGRRARNRSDLCGGEVGLCQGMWTVPR